MIAIALSHSDAEDGSTHAAVFCLALMGTDYGSFLEEAHRVLRVKGHLWIAEVRSRFAKGADVQEGSEGQEDLQPFLKALQQLGFEILQTDASNRMFITIEAHKKQIQGTGPKRWPKLKACQYKKR